MEIIDIITQTRDIFFKFVDICNTEYRLDLSLQFYRNIIASHRRIADLDELISSDEFLTKIYDTLKEWDMNKRGAKLADFRTAFASIRSNREDLSKLYRHRLEEVAEYDFDGLLEHLNRPFNDLKIMATKRRIVGVSKTLHFLLPDLVMPIDSSNTMLAFYGYNRYDSNAEKEFKTFADILLKSCRIAKRLDLSKSDVSDKHWSCSVPKLIDNAIFGFFIKVKNLIKNKKK